jgi:hypothetical protein
MTTKLLFCLLILTSKSNVAADQKSSTGKKSQAVHLGCLYCSKSYQHINSIISHMERTHRVFYTCLQYRQIKSLGSIKEGSTQTRKPNSLGKHMNFEVSCLGPIVDSKRKTTPPKSAEDVRDDRPQIKRKVATPLEPVAAPMPAIAAPVGALVVPTRGPINYADLPVIGDYYAVYDEIFKDL